MRPDSLVYIGRGGSNPAPAFPVAIHYAALMPGPSRAPAAPCPQGVIWNESAWPVVQITFTDTDGDEHFSWVLKQFEGLFARRDRYVFLLDAAKATKIPSPSARHMIGKWQNDHREDSKRWCAGGVILISSALVRGAVTAMSWVHKPAVKQYFPPTRKEGVEWCIKTAEENGLTVSAAARLLLQSALG
jgi:hypothetical protein